MTQISDTAHHQIICKKSGIFNTLVPLKFREIARLEEQVIVLPVTNACSACDQV